MGWVWVFAVFLFFGFVLFNAQRDIPCHVSLRMQQEIIKRQFNPGYLLLPSHFLSYHLAFYD